MISFRHGFNVGLLEMEYRIPNFVRAAECIIALPKPGQGVPTGQAEFAARGARLAPALASDWFVGANVPQIFRGLYQYRNECVHGMLPFEALRRRGGGGLDDAARLEYLAEHLARDSLLSIMRRPATHPLFTDRATIEAAWVQGQIA